jgi:hypothetical protein
MNKHQFPPIQDKAHFPLLSASDELPCGHLMACERLVFFAAEDPAATASVILKEGVEWHLYGDTRWPALSSWLEINTSPGSFPGYSGVLVMTYEISDNKADPFDWIARNGPLSQIFPEERSAMAIQQRLKMLRQQAASTEQVSGPTDSEPRYIQSYCIYRGQRDVRLIASYTDMLNSEGIPIQRYRMANVQPYDIEVCRFTLHALFRLNEARMAGMKFIAIPQLETCEPLNLSPDTKNPPWARFHPSRVLRTRPAVRAIPTPGNMIDGVMYMETAQQIMEARRLEANLHMLAFELEARPRSAISNDDDACMGAFSHRANGGAIYVLPDRLVEEFDNTDCDEIRMKDIKLPFRNLFLKFTPPQSLFLAEGAPVDGCYIVKQADEYLFSLTSHWAGVDYSQSLSIACLDPTFSLHLPAPEFSLDKPVQDTDLCINAAVELGIKDFLERNAPPTDNISQTVTRPDGTTAQVIDVRAESRRRRIEVFQSQEPVFRACLNTIVNAACFISFRPEDITEEWDGEPPAWVIEALNDNRDTRSARDRKQHALRAIASGDYTRIRICGKNLFAEVPHEGATGHGVSPRAHWRRGHWRRQRHGVGLSLVTPRWIRPTIVKKDNGPLVETRIYDVQEPPSSEKG